MNLRDILRGRWWSILLLLLFLALIVETAHFGWKAINVEGPPKAALTLAVSGAGSVNPGAGTYQFEKDTLIIVEAEPKEGWVFSHWVGPVADEKSPRTTLTLDRDIELEAVFVEEDLGLYAYTIDIRGNGDVFPGTGRYEFLPADEGTCIPVKAKPAPGYAFDRWTLNGREVSRDLVYHFALEDGAILTAYFKPLYRVTVDSTAGGIARGPSRLLEKGDQVKVEAISSPGYGFKEWIENGQVVSENPVHIFKVEGNHHLTARFLPIYKLNVLATEGGKAFASHDEALEGTEVKVVAVADPGYAFVGWSEGGKRLATGIDLGFAFIPLNYIRSTEYSFTLDRNRTLVAEFVEAYPIEVNVAGNVGGSVKAPAGPVLKGRKSVIIAVPDEGYLFDKWTEGDKEYYGEVFTFWGDRHLKLTAHFVPAIKIEALAEPEGGGEVKGGGTYKEGADVHLKALPAANHTFEGWYENGEKIGSDPVISLVASSDRRIVAQFEPFVEIAAEVAPPEGGRVRGAGFYQKGSEVVLTAVPNPGYEFDYWLMDGEQVPGVPARYSFTAGESHLFEAVFRKVNEYTVNISSSLPGAGFVSGGGTFNEGTRVTVFAIPKADYRFVGWTENGEVVSSDSSYTFTLDLDRSLVANFVKVHYLGLEAEPKVGGWFEGRGYHGAGSVVNVKAIPSYGYRFDRWTEGGMELGHGSSFDLTIERNYALVAHFVKAHRVTISLGEFDGGSVSGEGVHDVGATVTVRAEPYEGYVFSMWTRNGVKVSEEPEYSFTMPDEPVELVAHFLPLYEISVTASPAEGGTVSGEGIYIRGDSVTVHANANDGYEFRYWLLDGTVVSYSASYTFYAEKSCTLTAVFRALRKVTLEAAPLEGAADLYASWKYPGNQEHPEGESITITAIPAAGYSFDRWTIGSADGETLLDEEGQLAGSVHTFTVGDTDLHLVAHFEEIPSYTITVEANPPEYGTVKGADYYEEGSMVTVEATPSDPLYEFVSWTEGGVVVSTSATYTFIADRDRHLVANFRIKVYNVTVRVSHNDRGDVRITNSGEWNRDWGDQHVLNGVPHGTMLRLEARTEGRGIWQRWSDGVTAQNRDYTVLASATITAQFDRQSTCPYVYTFDGEEYHFEHAAISGSWNKVLEETGYYQLSNLAEIDGEYRIKLIEEARQKSFVNGFSLWVVDYPADAGVIEVLPDRHGNIYTIKERIAPTAFYNDEEQDLLEEITTDGRWVRSDYMRRYDEEKFLDLYVAEFPVEADATRAKFMVAVKNDLLREAAALMFLEQIDAVNNQWWIEEVFSSVQSLKDGIIDFLYSGDLQIEVWDGERWVLQDLIRQMWDPPKHADRLYEALIPLDLSRVDKGSGVLKVRLKSPSGFFVFHSVAIDYSEDQVVKVHEIKPESALLNGELDVLSVVLDPSDELRARLPHGNKIDAVFPSPPLNEGLERDFVFSLTGYHHYDLETVETPFGFKLEKNFFKSTWDLIKTVGKTIPKALKILPELLKMLQQGDPSNLEELARTTVKEQLLPWIEANKEQLNDVIEYFK
jgi:hypothetical protein